MLHGWRPAWLPDPDQAAALGFPLVGLDPDRYVEEMRVFAAGHADALDDEQRAARWYLDRPGALALVPLGASASTVVLKGSALRAARLRTGALAAHAPCLA